MPPPDVQEEVLGGPVQGVPSVCRVCVGLPTLPGPCNGLGRSVLTGALQGMNAHFVLRIATDRDWAADVRAQVRPSKNTFCPVSFCLVLLF